jgi:hypothetical protein
MLSWNCRAIVGEWFLLPSDHKLNIYIVAPLHTSSVEGQGYDV